MTATDCASPLQKTHSITFEPRQVCYPWHRWYGRNVLTRRAGGAHADVAYFCKLPEAPLDAMLVEIPKWMFDAAHCATMRLTEQAYVDCATLRALKNSIAEQRVSVKASVLQPQLSRQAGHGDKDDSDFKSKSDESAGAIRRTTRRTALERSHSIHTRRSEKTSGATARQCSDERSSSHSSKPGRAR
jgi:hypothetical protein